MSKPRHTPGPWEIREEYDRDVIWKEGATEPTERIAYTDGIGGDNHANARLIAAAPELYQALDELVAEFDATNADRDPAKDGLYPDTGGMIMARAAIKKAKGE